MSDAAAVGALLLRHRHPLLAYLRAVVPDLHAVEDLFQDVSVTALARAADFRDGTNFVAWARAIARFKIQEWLRRKKGVTLDDALLAELERAFDAAVGPELDARQDLLRACLEELTDAARRLLTWRYDEGLAPVAVARRLGQSRAAVNSLLQRTREVLRDCVERKGGGAWTRATPIS